MVRYAFLEATVECRTLGSASPSQSHQREGKSRSGNVGELTAYAARLQRETAGLDRGVVDASQSLESWRSSAEALDSANAELRVQSVALHTHLNQQRTDIRREEAATSQLQECITKAQCELQQVVDKINTRRIQLGQANEAALQTSSLLIHEELPKLQRQEREIQKSLVAMQKTNDDRFLELQRHRRLAQKQHDVDERRILFHSKSPPTSATNSSQSRRTKSPRKAKSPTKKLGPKIGKRGSSPYLATEEIPLIVAFGSGGSRKCWPAVPTPHTSPSHSKAVLKDGYQGTNSSRYAVQSGAQSSPTATSPAVASRVSMPNDVADKRANAILGGGHSYSGIHSVKLQQETRVEDVKRPRPRTTRAEVPTKNQFQSVIVTTSIEGTRTPAGNLLYTQPIVREY